MKCTECQMLLSLFEDRLLTNEQQIEINTHLLNCPECRKQAELLNEENNVIRQVLEMPPLPDAFTESILNRLEPYAITESEPLSTTAISKPALQRRRGRLKKLWVASVVVATLLALTAGTLVSPAFAAYISSFFSRIGGELGVKLADQQGYSASVNMKTTSQGFTLHIKDLIADPTRLVVSYVIEDDKGNIISDLFIPTYGENKIYISDDAQNKIPSRANFQRGDDYADFVFDLDNPPDQLVLHLEIKEFGSKTTLPVDWQLSIPVDLSKSKKATTTLPIQEKYITSQGVAFELQKIVYAPSATRMSIQTELTQAAKERFTQQAQAISGIKIDDKTLERYGHPLFTYHLENQRGEILSTSTIAQFNPNGLGQIYMTNNVEAEPGKEVWHASYVPLQTSEPIFFVLDEITLTEPANMKITFTPAAVKKEPVSKEYLGNRYTVISAEKRPSSDSQENLWEITLEGSLQNDTFNQWAVLDNLGKEYEVEVDYANSWTSKKEFNQTLLVKGITKEPKQLTLVLKTVKNRYTDFHWKVQIPQP